MKRVALFLLIISVAFGTFVHAETREERFEKVRKECTEQAKKELDYYNPHFLVREKCRRIDSLHGDFRRCAHERNHLRIAAACSHQWEDIGPGTRGCAKCASIANFLGGKWMVVFTDGLYVGPDPLLHPDEYGLKE